MQTGFDLLPRRLLRNAGPPTTVKAFRGVQIDDRRLSMVVSPDAPLLTLYEGTLHGEGPAWQAMHHRLVWSDVPNRRLLGWYPDGHVEVLIDGTWFMNGNAVEANGALVHCEHGRRCISRGGDYDREPEPIVTHYQGKRINSPNDIAVAPDGTIWFTDPTFGIIMPNQGALAEPELDHRSLYRFDPRTGDLNRMADFEEPNGLAFTADGATLYVSDTSLSLGEVPRHTAGTKHEIIAFDVEEGGALFEPAVLLPYRPRLSRRLCGRCARLGVDERSGRRAYLVSRSAQAGLRANTRGRLELHLWRPGRTASVHRSDSIFAGDRPYQLS